MWKKKKLIGYWMYLGHMWQCEKSQSGPSLHVTIFYFHMLNIWFTSENNHMLNCGIQMQVHKCQRDLKCQYCVKVSSVQFLHIQMFVHLWRIRHVKSQNSNVKKHFTWFHVPCFFSLHVEIVIHMLKKLITCECMKFTCEHLNFTFEFASVNVKKSNCPVHMWHYSISTCGKVNCIWM